MPVWKDIPGYEGLYEVSDTGTVRTIERFYASGKSKTTIRYVKEKCKGQTNDKDGYYRVTLCKDGKKKRKHVHKLVALAFLGEPLKDQQIRHLDHSRTNNNLSNLCYGTAQENSRDMINNPNYQHPRGMLGKCHSKETKQKMSAAHKKLGTRPPNRKEGSP